MQQHLQESVVGIKVPTLQHGPETELNKLISSFSLLTARGLTRWFHQVIVLAKLTTN